MLMDSVSEAVDYELNNLPGCAYYRLQVPHLPPASSKMNDVGEANLEYLQRVAREFVDKEKDTITTVTRELLTALNT